MVDKADVDDDVLENGEVSAVDLRKGFELEATGGGAGETELVCIGGSEAGCTEVGRPPGVRDRLIPLGAVEDDGESVGGGRPFPS